MVGLLWEGFRESRRCSRDTYPESYIAEYILIYEDKLSEVCADVRAGRARHDPFFVDNLLVRTYSLIVMIRWTGLAPWEFEFPFPGSLTSTFLAGLC